MARLGLPRLYQGGGVVPGFFGIDPGIGGGVALVRDGGAYGWGARTPLIKGKKSDYDIPGMRDLIMRGATDFSSLLVGIEKVHTLPRDGRVGAFNFGRGYGLWLGLLTGLGIPYMEITPQRWQARMLAGLPRGPHTKTSAVRAAQSRFPDMQGMDVKANWGVADAALIAAYTRQHHLGGRT